MKRRYLPRLKLTIRPDHYLKGDCSDPHSCMIAQAITEKFGKHCRPFADTQFIKYTDTDRGLRLWYPTPHIAQMEILRFDGDKSKTEKGTRFEILTQAIKSVKAGWAASHPGASAQTRKRRKDDNYRNPATKGTKGRLHIPHTRIAGIFLGRRLKGRLVPVKGD